MSMQIQGAKECPYCGENALEPEGTCSICQNCFRSPCE